MPSPFDPALSRRQFLGGTGMSLGSVALAHLMAAAPLRTADAAGSTVGRGPHFAPRAKRVIWLFMHGGPSHVDLLDPKPDLLRYAGKPLPDSFGSFETRRKVAQNPLLGPVKPFRPRGQSGIEISDFLPHMAGLADELCLIRSCHGDSVNHPQSVYQMNTGSILMGRPSLGSWVSYGLGSENEDMPAFVVMPDPGGGLKGGPPAWGNGYLPATYQGTTMRPGEQPILDLKPAASMTSQRQRSTLDLVRQMNELHAGQREMDTQLMARLQAYELAYRMQSAAPEAVDISRETEATRELYGLDHPVTREFGTRCLLARRMIERGVRFVQLYSGDTNGWDAHEDVLKNHTLHCERTDKPVAGLLRDLKQRGLLEDTLVIWGGEFGRMPMSEKGTGRDHNPYGYTTVMAGAGVKGGHVHGATDELGLRAERDKVHVHDLHATILHLLGVDHERLTYRHHGRDDRLTDVAGQVVKGILA
ncbi:DUF1501 domain-containing protein [Verrucomicrobium sp. BvORR106]|uniref:DUF1501 domain-containing protein n=1 Tax=Verrucomicrobium sp. BvORR106 TaxID=1403819 RepID=UPI000571FEBC|nr:DUF1501 domain-containing protein [Verrucomicrobium sp. BvORR106]